MDKSSAAFVREINIFIFYAKNLWPIHRKFVGSVLSRRCQKCALSEKAQPIENGLCANCRSPEKPNLATQHQTSTTLQNSLTETLLKAQGQGVNGIDALLLFSGGKDSLYMTAEIKRIAPKLRLLALTVDNTFMSPIALNNIANSVKALRIPHLSYRVADNFCEKMFRYAFLHLNSKGTSGTVDQFDGDLTHDIARNVAAQMQIPLILSGLSPIQVENILGIKSFLMPPERERIVRTHVADLDLKNIFTEGEMALWWNPTRYDEKNIARFIFPFYAWPYDESEIKRQVVKMNLTQPGADNPLLTNNQLIPLMAMVDIAFLGYSSFEPEFTKLIRTGFAEYRLWRAIFEMTEYAAKTGHFVSASLDGILQRLGLTRKELKLV